MTETSPSKNDDKDKDSRRRVATGGLRRVFKQRREESRPITRREEALDGDSEDENLNPTAPVTQTTSHHYTLNMAAPQPPASDPLLGHVFLLLESVCLFIVYFL